ELADVALDGLATEGVELGDAERLDVPLAGGPDLLLDLDLHRQAVTVPATLPLDEVPGHRLEPREDVLERPGLDVMQPRLRVRGRRPLVEDPPGSALAQRHGPSEDVGAIPERKDVALEGGEAHLGVDRLEPHLHPPGSSL